MLIDPDYRARIRRSIPLLAALRPYKVVLHGPCEACSCVLFGEVLDGFRCLHCAPPLSMTEDHRVLVAQTITEASKLPAGAMFMCGRRKCTYINLDERR